MMSGEKFAFKCSNFTKTQAWFYFVDFFCSFFFISVKTQACDHSSQDQQKNERCLLSNLFKIGLLIIRCITARGVTGDTILNFEKVGRHLSSFLWG